jgi:NADPH:quinone reductase-like Zn-dependent oxidoreductase
VNRTSTIVSSSLFARPRTLGHAESAAIPLPALTAWQGLFDHGRLRRSLALLRPGGRLVSVAEEQPPDGGVYFVVEPNRDQLTSLARLADLGEVRPPAVEVFPLTSAREAFARSLERGLHAKVVLAVA